MERADLIKVVQATGCAEESGGAYFLRDPRWNELEQAQVARLQLAGETAGAGKAGERGWLCLPTGGTTGGVRFARHDEHTLRAAVAGFQSFFGLEQVNAVDVLPAYHVSGFMARVRCAATGGCHVAADWRNVEGGKWPKPDEAVGRWVISLVPTQLQRLLGSPVTTDWLRSFAAIFVGGGPSWPELTEQAARLGLPLALSYGMTESAAMVAAITPELFLGGERAGLTMMPHARITLASDGTIGIEGESLFCGYYPAFTASRRFQTDDWGRWDEAGRLHVLGRKDAMIITGGKKVQPVEVEAALQATGQFVDVAVLGVPDAEWGEVVVACYPRGETAMPNFSVVERGLESGLAAYKRPKRYLAIADWPRTAQGKLSRVELAKRIARIEGAARPA